MKSTAVLFLTLIFFNLVQQSDFPSGKENRSENNSCGVATIHYKRRNADYDGWGLHVWGSTGQIGITWDNPFPPSGEDEFGIYWEVSMREGAEFLNYIIHKNDLKDPGPDQELIFAVKGCQVWQVQGNPEQFTDPILAAQALEINLTDAPQAAPNQVVIHYRRTDEEYDGWGLHIWGPTAEENITWGNPLRPAGQDDYGVYWVVEMRDGVDHLNYIVHRGDEKDPGPDQQAVFSEIGREFWLIEGSGEQFSDPEPAREALLVAGVGDIVNKARAHWLTREFIAWDVPYGDRAIFTLHVSREGSIRVTRDGLVGGEEIQLNYYDDQLPDSLAEKYPHLKYHTILTVPAEIQERVPGILTGQFAISVRAPDGETFAATALQVPGVLDHLYAHDEALGVIIQEGTPLIRVWAPTARDVTFHLYETSQPDSPSKVFKMDFIPGNGIWQITGDPSWVGKYYLYEVDVYDRQAGEYTSNLVTDPYSISLSMNSTRSQIIDLDAPELIPAGWASFEKPTLESFTDISLYELHVRDFSIRDGSLPVEKRGKFLAFTHPTSNGMSHLRDLADAGITHLHLLPTFDIATINEDSSTWVTPDFQELASFPPDSTRQQEIISGGREQDGYNWGYDPYHYSVPEGSYSTQPDGPRRVLEFREMVKALNEMGLRVVIDVVYNHTHASGFSDKSVLDKIVPGYYHRLDENGQTTTSTCCPNTATEHTMMRKLMVDSVLLWAKEYKVDGFRFDLMGHHMLSDMQEIRAALDAVTVSEDGVDGKLIYLYGEGWDFGEVADNSRGINASQLNLAGSGIGSFNDRFRDAVRGGSPFADKLTQGFITGLYTDPNQHSSSPSLDLQQLLLSQDLIRVSLAGNLADFTFENASGKTAAGQDILYNGEPCGYTASPRENILYISAHDNETLFDAIQYKAPLDLSMDERVRMQNLGLSLVTFSQGIPFYHAGSDILRSKSMDRDSYQSGDWFNALDWTLRDNNWGRGLPPAQTNQAAWPLISERLGNPDLAPRPENLKNARDHFLEILSIRKSSPLFHLETARDVQERVNFHNTGPDQVPGLIVMSLRDLPEYRLDSEYDWMIVFFNASPDEIHFGPLDIAGEDFHLHPIQVNSQDPVVRMAGYNPQTGIFTVPGRTSAVFVHSAPIPGRAAENNNGSAGGWRDFPASTPSGVMLLAGLLLLIGAGFAAFQAQKRK